MTSDWSLGQQEQVFRGCALLKTANQSTGGWAGVDQIRFCVADVQTASRHKVGCVKLAELVVQMDQEATAIPLSASLWL